MPHELSMLTWHPRDTTVAKIYKETPSNFYYFNSISSLLYPPLATARDVDFPRTAGCTCCHGAVRAIAACVGCRRAGHRPVHAMCKPRPGSSIAACGILSSSLSSSTSSFTMRCLATARDSSATAARHHLARCDGPGFQNVKQEN